LHLVLKLRGGGGSDCFTITNLLIGAKTCKKEYSMSNDLTIQSIVEWI